MLELGAKPRFLVTVEFLDVFKSVLGAKSRKNCILSSSDKIFVFGKNGPLIFDLREKFLAKDMSWSKLPGHLPFSLLSSSALGLNFTTDRDCPN